MLPVYVNELARALYIEDALLISDEWEAAPEKVRDRYVAKAVRVVRTLQLAGCTLEYNPEGRAL